MYIKSRINEPTELIKLIDIIKGIRSDLSWRRNEKCDHCQAARYAILCCCSLAAVTQLILSAFTECSLEDVRRDHICLSSRLANIPE